MKRMIAALTITSSVLALVCNSASAGDATTVPQHGIAVRPYLSLVPVMVCPNSTEVFHTNTVESRAYCGSSKKWGETAAVSPEGYLELTCPGAKLKSIGYSRTSVVIVFDLPANGCTPPAKS